MADKPKARTRRSDKRLKEQRFKLQVIDDVTSHIMVTGALLACGNVVTDMLVEQFSVSHDKGIEFVKEMIERATVLYGKYILEGLPKDEETDDGSDQSQ